MRITTWNVNGIRAAIRKGLPDVIAAIDPDVLLLQEIRATPEQIPAEWVSPEGWHVRWHPAEKLGYAGVAVWSREPFDVLDTGVEAGSRVDPEGRLLLVRTGDVRLASVYLPSGSSGEHRQKEKDRWMPKFERWASSYVRGRLPTVLAGDLNIAHTERDIFHAKSNQKSSGFLPHERAWFGGMLDAGWHDLVREHAGEVDGPYSWWSNRGQARALDRGWRIDYHLANRAAQRVFRGAVTHRDDAMGVSDHAPVSVDLDL